MEKETKLYRQWIAAIIVTVGQFMMGMFLGWSSPSLRFMRSRDSAVHLSEAEISWTVSVLYLGSTLSPVPTGWLMDFWGRKTTLMVMATTAVISWVITILAQNPAGIYVARFLGGVWGGVTYTIAPVYLCEIAEAKVRGAINSLFILMAYMGVMFEYVIGPKVSYTCLSVISLSVPLVFMAALAWVPESPYFYLMRGDRRHAAWSLAWLRCKDSPGQVEEELTHLEAAVLTDMQNRGRFIDLVSSVSSRRALLITEVSAVLQRMSGISVIMAYASAAIPKTGGLTSNDCAIILCLVWIVFGLLSTFLVDLVGRRLLLAISCAGCALANAMVSSWFFLDSETSWDAMSVSWFPLLSFLLYGAFFPVGLGCVPNMVQGEMFPSNTRALASGVTSTVIALTSLVSNKLYHSVTEEAGLYLNYAVFAVCCLLGVWFALYVLIETRGKTLQDIQYELVRSADDSGGKR